MLMIACSITALKDQMRVLKFCDSLYLTNNTPRNHYNIKDGCTY